MDKITDWTAKRSGSTITVQGKKNGEDFILTGIEEITLGVNGPVASSADGKTYELSAYKK